MAALFFFVVIFLINSSLTTSNGCILLDEFDAYLTQLFNKFSTTDSYEYIYCLDFALYGHKNRCKRSIFARPVKTKHCDSVRTAANGSPEERFFDSYHPNAGQFESQLYTHDIDPEILCEAMHKFNKIPKSDRSKKDYAKIFNSTVKYAAFHWVERAVSIHQMAVSTAKYTGKMPKATPSSYDVEGCYFDIIKAIAKFLNVPAPYSWECLKNFKKCPNKMHF